MNGCRLLLPNGSLQDVVLKLLADAGIPIFLSPGRSYRALIGNSRLFPEPYNWATLLRPWDSPWIIADQRLDLAFTGDDCIAESGRKDELVILRHYPLSRGGVGKTKLVLAVPKGSPIHSVRDLGSDHELVTEYPHFASDWTAKNGVIPRIRACHGSTEGYIEIADAILENSETGRSLAENGWVILEESILESQTCLITHPKAWQNGRSHEVIEEIILLLDAVISGRTRRLVKCNVTKGRLAAILAFMPAADKPTVNELAGDGGFSVESIIEQDKLDSLLVQLNQAGATAIFDLDVGKFIP